MSRSSEARKNNSVYLRREPHVKHDDSTFSLHSGGPSLDDLSALDSQKQLVICNNDKLDNERSTIYKQQALENSNGIVYSGHSSESDSIIECSSDELLLGHNSASEYCSSADVFCCSSNSDLGDHELYSDKIGADDSGECISIEIGVPKLFAEQTLKRRSNETLSFEIMDDSLGTNGYQTCRRSCKVCGILDNTLNMLICDHCEEAFHVSCCKPRVEDIYVEEWYCQSCVRKKPRSLLEVTKEGKSEYWKKFQSASSLISLMVQDTETYTSDVRIGEDFQAKVPDWSRPTADDYNYFDQADMEVVLGSNERDNSQRTATWNWLQCREVICDNSKDGGSEVICGKWRWAPLCEDQTDDWDCSCAIPWDPAHADCAVPQEISTEEVKKQREYIQRVKFRLSARKQRLEGGER